MMKSNVRPPFLMWLAFAVQLCGCLAAAGQTAENAPGVKLGAATATPQAESSSVRLWDVVNGKVRAFLAGEGEVTSVAFSPDGKLLATANAERVISLWGFDDGRRIRTLTGHKGAVQSLAFSPDGRLLASGGWDRQVRLWEVATGKEVASLQGNSGEVLSVAFSPDGRYLAAGGGDEKVRVWDLKTHRLARTFQGHSSKVNSVAFNRDGTVLATGSDDKTIKLWEMSSGKLLFTLGGHTGAVESVAFNPRDGSLASGSKDQTVRVWNAAGGELRTLTGHISSINSVAFSADGRMLSSGSYDRTIKLWDADTGAELKTLEGHTQRVTSTAFSPDGRTLASVGAPSLTESSTLHVLALGVSAYSDGGLPRVDFAAKDASDFAAGVEKVAGTKFARINVTTLTDFAASSARLASSFAQLVGEVKPQDTFVFFFAGHATSQYSPSLGAETFLLLSSDGREITDIELKSWLGKIEARRQLVILETRDWHKGYRTFFKRMAKEGEKLERLLGRDTFILANASKGTPLPGLRNQFLTHTLLEGLAGAAADGRGGLTAKGLFDYAKGRQSALPKGLQEKAGDLGSYEVGEDFQLGVIRRSSMTDPERTAGWRTAPLSRLDVTSLFRASTEAGAVFGVGPQLINAAWERGGNRREASAPQLSPSQQPALASARARDTPARRLTRKGKDYALLIATDSYQKWRPLSNPVADAKAVAAELKQYYGFETEVIENPTKAEVVDALEKYYNRKAGEDDQLFVFFAGHGSFLPLTNTGYLVFKDSRYDDKVGDSYLSYDILSRVLDGFTYKHVYLVIDACYGGMFGEALARRGGEDDDPRPEIIERRMQFMTRQFLTSGGKEYVPDGRPGHHSPFTRGLLEALRSYGGRDGYVNVKKLLVYVDGINPMPHNGGWGKDEPGSDFFFITRTP